MYLLPKPGTGYEFQYVISIYYLLYLLLIMLIEQEFCKEYNVRYRRDQFFDECSKEMQRYFGYYQDILKGNNSPNKEYNKDKDKDEDEDKYKDYKALNLSSQPLRFS